MTARTRGCVAGAHEYFKLVAAVIAGVFVDRHISSSSVRIFVSRKATRNVQDQALLLLAGAGHASSLCQCKTDQVGNRYSFTVAQGFSSSSPHWARHATVPNEPVVLGWWPGLLKQFHADRSHHSCGLLGGTAAFPGRWRLIRNPGGFKLVGQVAPLAASITSSAYAVLLFIASPQVHWGEPISLGAGTIVGGLCVT